MDRGAWQATVHVVARVRHKLATKPPPTTTPSRNSAEPFRCSVIIMLLAGGLLWWGSGRGVSQKGGVEEKRKEGSQVESGHGG